MSKSLVDAIYERYGEIGDCSSSISCSINCSEFSESSASCSPMSSPITDGENEHSNSNLTNLSSSVSNSPSNNFSADISFFIPPVCSPRKTQSGLIMTSVKSLIMSNKCLNQVGDFEELENCCKNVLELDLAKNEFIDWSEIRKILQALKNLRLLNLSHNPLTDSINYEKVNQETTLNSALDYFYSEWSLENNVFQQLQTLILNSCYLDLKIVEFLLSRMPNLNELHLSSNNYSCVTFSDEFRKDSIKILYLNNNSFSRWSEILKFGNCFPMLENLVLSDNPLSDFTTCPTSTSNTSNSFQNLEILILNKLQISEWSAIDQLNDFPSLKHARIQNVPLLYDYNEEEKYFLLVGHLDDRMLSLNGSKITTEDKENCERKYIRYYLDSVEKPKRYYELENRHGKLNKLADVNLEANKRVNCKIKFRDTHIYHKIDVRQTVGDFKKQLEKFVGYPSSRFRVFYIDFEACSMSIYGPEELKYVNRCLYSFNIVEGDEFEIDLKPPPVIHSASEHQFQHTTSHHHVSNTSVSKPLNIRSRKISDNSSSGELSTSFTNRACADKKNKPVGFCSANPSKTTRKKGESIDDFCSLPSNLNKKNKTIVKKSGGGEVMVDSDKAKIPIFTAGPGINEDIAT